jgi:hypothetical protein
MLRAGAYATGLPIGGVASTSNVLTRNAGCSSANPVVPRVSIDKQSSKRIDMAGPPSTESWLVLVLDILPEYQRLQNKISISHGMAN